VLATFAAAALYSSRVWVALFLCRGELISGAGLARAEEGRDAYGGLMTPTMPLSQCVGTVQ
jgi:hypothetical protein